MRVRLCSDLESAKRYEGRGERMPDLHYLEYLLVILAKPATVRERARPLTLGVRYRANSQGDRRRARGARTPELGTFPGLLCRTMSTRLWALGGVILRRRPFPPSEVAQFC